MNLSDHLTLAEFTASDHALKYGIENTITPDLMKHAIAWAETIYEPMYQEFGDRLSLTSGYRGVTLNTAVKGSKTSAHRFACAGDLKVKGLDSADVTVIAFQIIKEFDQLICEYPNRESGGWLHAGLDHKGNNRMEVRIKHTGVDGYPLIGSYK